MFKRIYVCTFLVMFIHQDALTQSTAPQRKYRCGLTSAEYFELKDVKSKMREDDKKRIFKLKKINKKYANKYKSLKTYKEKQDYVQYLINYEFNKFDPNDPDDRDVVNFLQLFDFTIVSAKDQERCEPLAKALSEYKDSLLFYYKPIQKVWMPGIHL